MALVSTVDVRNIIRAKSLSSDQITAIIQVADIVVQEQLTNQGFSIARLKIIEQYLAAHLCAVSDSTERMKDIRTGGVRGVEVAKTDAVGLGLSQTLFGQTAMMLDTSNTLRAADKGGNLYFSVSRSPCWPIAFRGILFGDTWN